MNEQQTIEIFLKFLDRITEALEDIADELREINAALVEVQGVPDEPAQ